MSRSHGRSHGVNVLGVHFEHAFPDPPPVPDLTADFDWQTWSKDAICFPLKEGCELNIYAVNPNDLSCYSLATFTFCDARNCCWGLSIYTAYCTVIESKIYLIGRNDPNFGFFTELWIWDILEAQNKKLAGEPYDWKLGPPLNSAKDIGLVFSLCGDLYALDICRCFRQPFAPISQMRKASSQQTKTREENPTDFERLPVSSSIHSSSLSWVPLPPLQLEKYGQLSFNGYCCLEDRFLLHLYDRDRLSYLFCFNVKTGMWTQRRFSDIPLLEKLLFGELEGSGLHCMQYSANVQDQALFVSPRIGKLSVFDFGALSDLIGEKGSESKLKYPCFSLDLKNTRKLKNVLHSPPQSTFEHCQTIYLGNQRYCWIACFYGFDYKLYAWVCTFDLKKKTSEESYANTSERGSRNKRGISAANDVAKLWMLSDGGVFLPKRLLQWADWS